MHQILLANSRRIELIKKQIKNQQRYKQLVYSFINF